MGSNRVDRLIYRSFIIDLFVVVKPLSDDTGVKFEPVVALGGFLNFWFGMVVSCIQPGHGCDHRLGIRYNASARSGQHELSD